MILPAAGYCSKHLQQKLFMTQLLGLGLKSTEYKVDLGSVLITSSPQAMLAVSVACGRAA